MMKIKIHKGFITLKSGKNGPLFIAPHSGMALNNPEGEIDRGTQSVAYHYLKKYGGSAIISLFSRERDLGIDLWRPMPVGRKISKKYAWYPFSRKYDEEKKKIYKKFWKFIFSQKSDTIIILHRQLPRVKNYPSIIDVVSIIGRGFSRKRMRKVIEKMNKEYEDRFYWLRDEYRELMLVYIDYCLLCYKKHIKSFLKKDFITFKKTLGVQATKKLEKNFSKSLLKKYILKLIHKQPDLKITLEKNFTGKYIGKVLDPILDDRLVVSFEINQLLSQYYPLLTAKIIHEIIYEYKKAE